MNPPPAPFQVARPHPALAPYILAYVGMEQPATETLQVAALTTPTLMVTWSGAVRPLTAPSGKRGIPLTVLAGPLTHSHRVRATVGSRGFHVRFRPTGAWRLLGVQPAADGWTDGLPPEVERWAEAVADAPSFDARVALADAFWTGYPPAPQTWSDPAVDLIVQTAGALPIGVLARTLGVSERTLRRRFAHDVGLGVKTFAQIERYRQAHGLLLRSPRATWRDVCDQFGYADQAHFIRAFRRFTGETPTRWCPQDHPLDLGMGLRDEGTTLAASFNTAVA